MPKPGDALELVGIYEQDRGSVVRGFYHPEDTSPPSNLGDFLRTGGIVVEQFPTLGHTGSRLAQEASEDGPPGREQEWVLLPVGDHEAILNHGDENLPGIRFLTLAWSDGTTDWRISAAVGIVDSTVIVNLARWMYCG
jgi:hypothetical protein